MVLTQRPILSVIRSLGRLSRRWLDGDFSFRKKAVTRLESGSGFSRRAAEAAIDSIFSELSEKKLLALLRQELGDPRALDGFQKSASGRSRAAGPGTIFHIFSANVPNPAIQSFVFGMLIKSVNIGKVSSRDEGFLDIYLESLAAADKALAKTNILIGPSDKRVFDRSLASADLVVAYGQDETLADIRRRLSPKQDFFGYGHRVSVGFYTRRVLTKKNAGTLAQKTAFDVWMLDQRGCLSPLSIYVEKGGEVSPETFSVLLAGALDALCRQDKWPARRLFARAAANEAVKNKYASGRLGGKKTRILESDPRGQWLVVYDENIPDFPLACGRQAIVVKGFDRKGTVFDACAPFRSYLQAVSLECAPGERKALAGHWADAGVSRICPAGKLQRPPLSWHHDGKFNLASWVKWTDWEYGTIVR